MLNYSVDSIRESRARFIRDIEYIKEMCDDDFTDDRFFALDNKFGSHDTYDQYLNAASLMEQIPEDDTEEEEVKRILEATEDLSFDEMINVI